MKVSIKALKEALLLHQNAAVVAQQFELSLHQVYYFAKTRKIQLRKVGRPQKYNYNKKNLMKSIKRAILKRGGLLKLSQRKNIPYHVITNMAKKIA